MATTKKTAAMPSKSAMSATKSPSKSTATTKQSASKSGSMPASKSKTKMEAGQDMKLMDDVAIISDILGTEKALVGRYSKALTEISCEKLRTLVSGKLAELAEDQFDVFLYMNQRNLYPTEPAPAQKITEAKQKYTKAKQKMC